MSENQRRVPSYRKHKPTGQAVVTLGGHDFYLGPYGSAKSHAEYNRLIAEWSSNGYRAPRRDEDGYSVSELIADYWDRCQRHYVKNGKPTSEQAAVALALGPLRKLYGATEAAEFGPLALKACRQKMIDAGWERQSINRHVGRIRRMFKWAVENELVPPHVFHGLQAVAGLQKGRTDAKETEPIKPVPEAFVDAIRPYVSRYIWAMIQLQLLTGMRPGEVCLMRACDLDTSGKVWTYVPESHKTEHHGRGREIYLGPQAQLVVRPFLTTDLEAYLFSPAAADIERRAELRKNRKTPLRPGQEKRRRRKPVRKMASRYSPTSYRLAINRGIAKHNKQARAKDEAEIPHWHPNQLRHTAGSRVRKEEGLETAQVILGHAKADVTQVYAERDRARALEFMARHG